MKGKSWQKLKMAEKCGRKDAPCTKPKLQKESYEVCVCVWVCQKCRWTGRQQTKTKRGAWVNQGKQRMVETNSIHHHIQEQRIKWFGHLTRLPIHHLAQHAYNMRFSGRKARWRPRKTRINRVKETLSLYYIPPVQAFRRAADSLSLPAKPQVV